jgi:hypothetical protein
VVELYAPEKCSSALDTFLNPVIGGPGSSLSSAEHEGVGDERVCFVRDYRSQRPAPEAHVLPDQTDLAGAAQVLLPGPIPLFPKNESKPGSRLTNSCPISL